MLAGSPWSLSKEHLQWCSIYVICRVKLDEEKGQNMLLGCMRKIGFQLIRIPQLAVAGWLKKKAQHSCAPAEKKKSVINMI